MPPKKSSSRSGGARAARLLADLTDQLERHFEGETPVQELADFLQRPDTRSLVAMHEGLKRMEKQKRRTDDPAAVANSEAARRTEFVRCLQDGLEQLEPAAATDDEAGELYELLASARLTTFVEALEDIGHRNYDGERLQQRRQRQLQGGQQEADAAAEAAGGGGDGGGESLMPETQVDARFGVDSNGAAGNNNDAAAGGGGQQVQGQQQQPEWRGTQDDLDEFDRPQKMVAFNKAPGEDLGVTVGTIEWYDENTGQSGLDIVVERIMAGSRIEQQGVLKPYDVIKEVNGIPIDSPEKLQQVMRKASGNITLKVRSGFFDGAKASQATTFTYVKTLFSYDPQFDGLIPCREAGLKFTVGDVLQVVSQEDPNWWQARHWNSRGRAGLIPSLTLQERRAAFLQSTPERDAINYKVMGMGLSRKKKTVKMTYKANVAQAFERSDLNIYQEVARVPPFPRSLVVLLGASGVGKNSLLDQLIRRRPEAFARPIPHTSRPPRPGEVSGERYLFAGRSEMEVDVRSGAYLEHGELNGHLYGVKVDTLRSMVKPDRTLVLECSPDKARLVCTAEFKPYVLFVAAPTFECMKSMYELGTSLGLTSKIKKDEDFRRSIQESIQIERSYRHLFDSVLICDNFDACYEQLEATLESLTKEHQWLPVSWLY